DVDSQFAERHGGRSLQDQSMSTASKIALAYAPTAFNSGRNGCVASAPSLTAIRLPMPAPFSSHTTISPACGAAAPFNSASDNGTTSRNRAPVKLGWERLSVTVPTTLAILILPYVGQTFVSAKTSSILRCFN